MKITVVLLLVAGCALFALGQAQANSQPFTLTLGVEGNFFNWYQPSEGSHVVKTGSKIYLTIKKTNTSKGNLGCDRLTNSMTNLDPAYEYDVRHHNGNPVVKHVINHLELASTDLHGLGCEFKPGESSTSGGNEITRLYDISQPGEYAVQVSQPTSDKPDATAVKSNTLTLTVTDDDSVIEQATTPFALRIDAYAEGVSSYNLAVKAGEEVGIHIVKTNTSMRREEDCSMTHNSMTGLDDKYEYEVRDSAGNPVGKKAITSPEPFASVPSQGCTIKPGASQTSFATMSRLYDLSRPGNYTIQVSQPASDNPADGIVKSNVISVKVTR